MKDIYEFAKDFATGEVIEQPIGRICLCDGSIMRIVFGPEGVRVGIMEESIDSGAVVIWGKSPLEVSGFGVMPEKDGV